MTDRFVGLATTAEGHVFDPSPDVWRLGAGTGCACFNFMNLPAASAVLRSHIKATFLASIASAKTVGRLHDLTTLRALLRSIAADRPGAEVDEIRLADVEAFWGSLPRASKYRVRHLRNALVTWAATGVPGLASDLLRELPFLAFEAPRAGNAVRTCSPTKGALTAEQRDTMVEILLEAHDSGRAGRANCLLALLSAVFAPRPYQLALLKVADLVPTDDPEHFAADLLVPRVKQGQGATPRTETRRVGLVEAIARPMEQLASEAKAEAAAHGIDPSAAPMFFVTSFPGQPLPLRAPGMEGHIAPTKVSERISRVIRRLDAVPGRADGERVSPVRLRRTLASVLADRGASLEDIASVLDQTWVATAVIYVQQTASLADRLDQALGGPIADFASGLSAEVDEAVDDGGLTADQNTKEEADGE